MSVYFFLKGFVIGLAIAAPVGPIGVLCIQRTIAYGRLSGLATGLGAATADGFYGAVAAFGLAVIANFLTGLEFWFRLIGGLFLLYLGCRSFLSEPPQKVSESPHKGLLSDYLSTLFLTLTNPMTLLSFGFIFAGLGLGKSGGIISYATFMTLGVFLGSACWWLILSSGVGLLRVHLSTDAMKIVNWISGVVIAAFGIFALVGLAD